MHVRKVFRQVKPLGGNGRTHAGNAGSQALQHLALNAGAIGERSYRQTHLVKHLRQIRDMTNGHHTAVAQAANIVGHVTAHQQTPDARIMLPNQRHNLPDQPARRVLVRRMTVATDKRDVVPLGEWNICWSRRYRPAHDMNVGATNLRL